MSDSKASDDSKKQKPEADKESAPPTQKPPSKDKIVENDKKGLKRGNLDSDDR